MESDEVEASWAAVSPELQVSLSREALIRARHLVGAQAGLLAEQMERGMLPALDGPDALRLLAMILGAEETDLPTGVLQ